MLLSHKYFFAEKMGDYINKLEPVKVENDNEAKMLEGRDIAVVIRARPLL